MLNHLQVSSLTVYAFEMFMPTNKINSLHLNILIIFFTK